MEASTAAASIDIEVLSKFLGEPTTSNLVRAGSNPDESNMNSFLWSLYDCLRAVFFILVCQFILMLFGVSREEMPMIFITLLFIKVYELDRKIDWITPESDDIVEDSKEPVDGPGSS